MDMDATIGGRLEPKAVAEAAPHCETVGSIEVRPILDALRPGSRYGRPA